MDTVLFDLGGVLIDWNPRYLYRPLFGGDDAAMEDFLARVCPPEWNHEMDEGKPFAVAVAERQRLFPEQAQLIAQWHAGWPQMLRDEIPGTVAILRELRSRDVRLFALTNWSAETFPMARPRFPFFDWFDGIVVSGEVGWIKPDARIYRHLLDRYGLQADDCLFIDDSAANVAGAEAVGIKGLHFTSPTQLRGDLTGLGLL
jgi:2-haloacid dehalogenase